MTNNFTIGIDLGTTYCCLAIYKNGNAEIIPNELGDRTTPSFVSFTENERLIGTPAKNMLSLNPLNTIYDVKRLIGRQFNDPIVQEDSKYCSFKINNDNNKPMIKVTYKCETRDFTPEEISSMLLVKLKNIASSYLGHDVSNAVITVPAHFNDSQRQATKDAGTIAGLNVVRIINEPTAAAIAYGLDKLDDKSKNVLIYDFGGGTLDVSLLTINDGVFEVKATSGDTHLGGDDIDNCITNYILNEYNKKYKIDLSDNKKIIRKIRSASEKAKHILSGITQTTINIESLHDGNDFVITLSRAKFENLCNHIFLKTLEPIKKVIEDSKFDKSDIDDVVLVGGSTRIPKIQSLISEFFNNKELCKNINPDEAIAQGAAIQGAILSNVDNDKLDQMLLLDVTPLTLGIETTGNTMTTLIPRGTQLPTKKTQIFSTASDNQIGVTIKVYEGERQITLHNNKLGEFNLKGIPPMPRGVPQIEITYFVDTNGILKVSAVEKSTGKAENITITNDSNRLSKEQIDDMIKNSEKFKQDDLILKEYIDARNKLENYCYSIKNHILLNNLDKQNIIDKIEEILDWIENNLSSKKTSSLWDEAVLHPENNNYSFDELNEKYKEIEDMIDF